LIKYIKSVIWRAAKRLSYIEEARCLKVNIKQKSTSLATADLRNTLFATLHPPPPNPDVNCTHCKYAITKWQT